MWSRSNSHRQVAKNVKHKDRCSTNADPGNFLRAPGVFALDIATTIERPPYVNDEGGHPGVPVIRRVVNVAHKPGHEVKAEQSDHAEKHCALASPAGSDRRLQNRQ